MKTGCSTVGSIRALGAWGRKFESCHPDNINAFFEIIRPCGGMLYTTVLRSVAHSGLRVGIPPWLLKIINIKEFIIPGSKLHDRNRKDKHQSGYFCSRQCSGKYGRDIQLKRIEHKICERIKPIKYTQHDTPYSGDT